MADGLGHAAGQTESRFAVRVLAESGEQSELAAALPDLTTAADVASEWLNRADPGREGKAQLSIVRLQDGAEEIVLTYPPSLLHGPGDELRALFGFNPVTWRAQSLNRPATRERLLAPRPVPAPSRREPAPVLERDERRDEPREWEAFLHGAVVFMRSSWDDPPSRVFLLAAAFLMWFAVTLFEPVFLGVALLALTALGIRQRTKHGVEPDDDFF
jgi:hypothetical protein